MAPNSVKSVLISFIALALTFVYVVEAADADKTVTVNVGGRLYKYHVICENYEVFLDDLTEKCFTPVPPYLFGSVWSSDVQNAVTKLTDEGILLGATGTRDSDTEWSYTWPADGIVRNESTKFASITLEGVKAKNVTCVDNMYCNFDVEKVKSRPQPVKDEVVIAAKKDSGERKWLLRRDGLSPWYTAKCVLCQEILDVIPSSTVPSSTVPSSTVPSSTVPSSTVPSSTVPSSTVPSSTVPSSTVPSSTVPSSTVPSSTVPSLSVPFVSALNLFSSMLLAGVVSLIYL